VGVGKNKGKVEYRVSFRSLVVNRIPLILVVLPWPINESRTVWLLPRTRLLRLAQCRWCVL
jgi:hypothetical protein